MTTKPPYFPFYVNDFVSDGKVEAMDTREIGAYTLLLCKAWKEEPAGSIPADDEVLAKWTRLSMRDWLKCKTKVLAAFYLVDDRLIQKRLTAEYGKLMGKYEKAQQSGKKGATKRWGGHSDPNGDPNRVAIATPMLPQCDPNSIQNQNQNHIIKGNTESSVESLPVRNVPKSPTIEQVKSVASMRGIKEDEAEAFFYHFDGAGWIDKNSNPVMNWQSKLQSWVIQNRKTPQRTNNGKPAPNGGNFPREIKEGLQLKIMKIEGVN